MLLFVLVQFNFEIANIGCFAGIVGVVNNTSVRSVANANQNSNNNHYNQEFNNGKTTLYTHNNSVAQLKQNLSKKVIHC